MSGRSTVKGESRRVVFWNNNEAQQLEFNRKILPPRLDFRSASCLYIGYGTEDYLLVHL